MSGINNETLAMINFDGGTINNISPVKVATVTPNSGATPTSSVQGVFGSSYCMYIPQATNYAYLNVNVPVGDIKADAFTWEFWLQCPARKNDTDNGRRMWWISGLCSMDFARTDSNNAVWRFSSVTPTGTVEKTVTKGEWHHIAVVASSYLYVYLDGEEVGHSDLNTNSYFNATSYSLRIGEWFGNKIRWQLGEVYTEEFIPPSEPYTLDDTYPIYIVVDEDGVAYQAGTALNTLARLSDDWASEADKNSLINNSNPIQPNALRTMEKSFKVVTNYADAHSVEITKCNYVLFTADSPIEMYAEATVSSVSMSGKYTAYPYGNDTMGFMYSFDNVHYKTLNTSNQEVDIQNPLESYTAKELAELAGPVSVDKLKTVLNANKGHNIYLAFVSRANSNYSLDKNSLYSITISMHIDDRVGKLTSGYAYEHPDEYTVEITFDDDGDYKVNYMVKNLDSESNMSIVTNEAIDSLFG